ncbi:Zinc phosphodiesterase elac protein 2, partial [Globisporangium splendens]
MSCAVLLVRTKPLSSFSVIKSGRWTPIAHKQQAPHSLVSARAHRCPSQQQRLSSHRSLPFALRLAQEAPVHDDNDGALRLSLQSFEQTTTTQDGGANADFEHRLDGDGAKRAALDRDPARMCMEHHVRLAKLKHVFLTELRPHCVGGLPGMILTVSDTGKDALQIYGPPGTQRYIHATRHFLFRPNFGLQANDLVSAVLVSSAKSPLAGAKDGHSASKPQTLTACYSDDEISVYAVVTSRANAGIKRKVPESSSLPSTADDNGASASTASNDCVSYIVETAPQRGKFLVEKAIALGVPKGKFFGQLHHGKDVTLSDGRVVKSSECVSPTLPGSGCAVIACPSIAYVEELVKATEFTRYQVPSAALGDAAKKMPEVQLAALYHFAPSDVLHHPKYVEWVHAFGDDVDHIVLSHDACPRKTVYRASAKLQAQLQTVFPRAFPSSSYELGDAETPMSRNVTMAFSPKKPVIVGESMLKYTLVPTARRGFDAKTCFPHLNMDDIRASTAAAQEKLQRQDVAEGDNEDAATSPNVQGRITFLGTGCAIPSKYRNVTGMYLEIERNAATAVSEETKAWDGMMLDCGEGSFGQLYRYANGDMVRVHALVNNLKCIWISHNHADHHLGLLRMLSERSDATAPLMILGPTPVEYWLKEYAGIDSSIAGKYTFVDNYCFNSLDPRFEEAVAISKPTRAWLRDALQITELECVPVKHAFLSYALVVTFADSLKIAFSGDCRPSQELAAKARDAFLLIHEATFEDAMAQEAKSKDHSTTVEAIDVGRNANAKHIILTHFSQRYPKMPVLEQQEGGKTADVLTAIDMLSLRFQELHQPHLMEICTDLMARDDKEDENDEST